MKLKDTKLKRALIQMLPNIIGYCDQGLGHGHFGWISANRPLLDTELLYLCWLVEVGLTEGEYLAYGEQLGKDIKCHNKTEVEIARLSMSGSWQTRTKSLAKIKNVKL